MISPIFLVLLQCLLIGREAVAATPTKVSITLFGDEAIADVSPSYLGVNIDAASFYPDKRLDFKDKNLREIGRALVAASPEILILRIGGSSSDDVSFGDTKRDDMGITMNTEYWDEMFDFADYCGFSLIWDFNAMTMRNSKDEWNTTDAIEIIKHAKSKNQDIYGFQIGNEPGHFQTRHDGTPTPESHGQDFVDLDTILKKYYSSMDGHVPIIQGPNTCSDPPCANLTYFDKVLEVSKGTIRDITVHSYGLQGPKDGIKDGCNMDNFLQPSIWRSKLLPDFKNWVSHAKKIYPDSNIILSETATACDGGCPGLSNSFAAGFYFIDILGLTQQHGFYQVYRQDLVGFSGRNGGSSYALVGPAGWYNEQEGGILTPNPDFFTGLAWRKIMGSRILYASCSAHQDSVTIYSSCAPGGGTAYAFLNPTQSEIPFSIPSFEENGNGKDRVIDLYFFTARGNNLTSQTSLLNGIELIEPNSKIEPAFTSVNELTFPPYSYGFFVDRDSTPAACRPVRKDQNFGIKEDNVQPVDDKTINLNDCVDPRQYGLIEGNPGKNPGNWKQNTKAIQRAIDDKNYDCVQVKEGDYVVGEIFLRSNTIFRINKDARLLNAVNMTSNRGIVQMQNLKNVTLTGGGILYGNSEHYISYFDPVDNRFEPTFPDGSRPHLVFVNYSTDIRVSDLHLSNSTSFNLWIKGSSNVFVDGLTIIGDERFPNNDGIEPDSSRNVTIVNTYIDVSDDGISPISSPEDGPLHDLTVKNVTIRSKSHAIKFGSACNADCYDCLFENITIRDSNSGLSIQQRGKGAIYNITFRNIDINTRYQAPRWWGNGEWLSITVEQRKSSEDKIGKTSNLIFEHITAHSENGGLLSGLANDGIENVFFNDINITIASSIGNYSAGNGPACWLASAKKNILCMGTKDHRPSYIEDVDCSTFGNCRIPSKADGIALENIHNVTLKDVNVIFDKDKKDWFGDCITMDEKTSLVKRIGSQFCNEENKLFTSKSELSSVI